MNSVYADALESAMEIVKFNASVSEDRHLPLGDLEKKALMVLHMGRELDESDVANSVEDVFLELQIRWMLGAVESAFERAEACGCGESHTFREVARLFVNEEITPGTSTDKSIPHQIMFLEMSSEIYGIPRVRFDGEWAIDFLEELHLDENLFMIPGQMKSKTVRPPKKNKKNKKNKKKRKKR